MASEAILYLQKQVTLLHSKVDHLDRQIDLIFQDLNVNKGAKMYILLEEISEHLKILDRGINEEHIGTLKYKIDNVMKSIEYINRKIGPTPY